jgi:hypothetical protein
MKMESSNDFLSFLSAQEYYSILEVNPMFDRFVFRISEQVPAIVFTALAGALGWSLLIGWL